MRISQSRVLNHLIDLKGLVFGRWTVIRLHQKDRWGGKWECRCDCGTTRRVNGQNLRFGKSRSCGCLRTEIHTIHGKYRSKEYRAWINMKRRCDPRNSHKKIYRNHAGRGIMVCQEWQDNFELFYDQVGPAPSPRHQVDRVDNNGNYKPGNVRWVTGKENSRNTRKIREITMNGQTKPFSVWCEELGLTRQTVSRRLRYGWTPEEAFK